MKCSISTPSSSFSFFNVSRIYISALKSAFDQQLRRITKESENEVFSGRKHAWTWRTIKQHGAVKAAEIMVRAEEPSGFDELRRADRLDLTTEYLIVKGGFSVLFDDDVVRIAKERLEKK